MHGWWWWWCDGVLGHVITPPPPMYHPMHGPACPSTKHQIPPNLTYRHRVLIILLLIFTQNLLSTLLFKSCYTLLSSCCTMLPALDTGLKIHQWKNRRIVLSSSVVPNHCFVDHKHFLRCAKCSLKDLTMQLLIVKSYKRVVSIGTIFVLFIQPWWLSGIMNSKFK